MQINKICEKFGVKIIAQKDIKNGIINTTKIVTDISGKKYILQEINNDVFNDIDKLMDNIAKVSEYIHKMHKKNKDSIDTYYLLTASNNFYTSEKDEKEKPHFFRMYKYISNASTYDEADEYLLFQAGVGFGNFQKVLQSFPSNELHETIYNFHNTPYRYNILLQAINFAKTNNPKRYKNAKTTINFAIRNNEIANIIIDKIENKKIPIRVVHNDTKLNNVVLSNKDHKPVAVIDLDTVMPGSLLFDYGDAIRYCANTATEDETNVGLINIDYKKLKAFTKGYIQETKNILTPEEISLMPISPEILAYELGIRFLTDYLQNDKYFKIDSNRPNHNLERAISQFTIAEKFKKERAKIAKIINDELK